MGGFGDLQSKIILGYLVNCCHLHRLELEVKFMSQIVKHIKYT